MAGGGARACATENTSFQKNGAEREKPDTQLALLSVRAQLLSAVAHANTHVCNGIPSASLDKETCTRSLECPMHSLWPSFMCTCTVDGTSFRAKNNHVCSRWYAHASDVFATYRHASACDTPLHGWARCQADHSHEKVSSNPTNKKN